MWRTFENLLPVPERRGAEARWKSHGDRVQAGLHRSRCRHSRFLRHASVSAPWWSGLASLEQNRRKKTESVATLIFFSFFGTLAKRNGLCGLRNEEDAGFLWVAPCQRALRACSGGPERHLQKVQNSCWLRQRGPKHLHRRRPGRTCRDECAKRLRAWLFMQPTQTVALLSRTPLIPALLNAFLIRADGEWPGVTSAFRKHWTASCTVVRRTPRAALLCNWYAMCQIRV